MLVVVTVSLSCLSSFFFVRAAPPTGIYALSLHDALPISVVAAALRLGTTEHAARLLAIVVAVAVAASRSEEHTSELQSRLHLVCRLLLEKKKRLHRKREVVTL